MANYKGIIRATWFTVLVHAKSIAYFRAKLVIDMSMTLFRVLVLLFLYMNIYKIAPEVATVLPYKSALWSIGAYFFALAFSARRMFAFTSDLIYTGNIETYLVRPLHVLIFNAARLFGENLIQMTVAGLTIFATLAVFVGLPENLTPALVLVAVVLLILGLAIEILLAGIIGLLAIWLENATPVYWIADKFILILGGSYVPVAFFPHALKLLSEYSPFGATRFITYAFYPDFLVCCLTPKHSVPVQQRAKIFSN